MRDNKRVNMGASVLIYTIILVNIVLIMSIVIINNEGLLQSIYQYGNREKELLNDIQFKANLAFKYNNYINSDGSGFTDNLSCPGVITMSGATASGIISSSISYQSGKILCNGTYNSHSLSIRFNSGYNDFDIATYSGSTIALVGKIGTFSDSDTTNINFSSYTGTSDSLDDDFNSDNYKISSLGTYPYPNNYQDNDADGRKTIYGYIPPNTGFQNIFWNNTKIQQYILQNTNNSDGINTLLGTGSLYFFLDADKNFHIKVITFNRNSYNISKELSVLSESQSNALSSAVGYIQNSLSLSGGLTGNEYTFDTLNNDYGIFLQNDGTGVLLYKLTAKTLTGADVYINPINDADTNIMEVLGYDIIKIGGKYISKLLEIAGNKVKKSAKIANFGSYRGWDNETYALSCDDYRNPSDPLGAYTGSIGTGIYRIDSDSAGSAIPFDVYCDMSTGSGYASVFKMDSALTLDSRQSVMAFSEDDHDTASLWVDLSAKITSTNSDTNNTSIFYTWQRDGTQSLVNTSLSNRPTGISDYAVPIVFPASNKVVWIDDNNDIIKWDNTSVTFASLGISFGVTNSNHKNFYIISDGVSSAHLGNASTSNAYVLNFNFFKNTVSQQTATKLIPAGGWFVTEEDAFGHQLFTVNGRGMYYKGGAQFRLGGYLNNPNSLTNDYAVGSNGNDGPQCGLDFFMRVDNSKKLWFGDWGHDDGGFFNFGNDSALGVMSSNIDYIP